MSKQLDLTGQRFGRLIAIEKASDPKQNKDRRTFWKCKCDCGNERIVSTHDLRRQHAKSCGCWRKECMREFKEKLAGRVTHGMSRERLFRIWDGMIKRCEDPASCAYKNYGGRGITVCEEWHSLESFIEWARNNGYSESLSIDRIDNNAGYSPDNCRWANRVEQANNKRNNVLITYNGETHTLPEWSTITGIKQATLRYRMGSGWDIYEVMNTPVKTGRHCGR